MDKELSTVVLSGTDFQEVYDAVYLYNHMYEDEDISKAMKGLEDALVILKKYIC